MKDQAFSFYWVMDYLQLYVIISSWTSQQGVCAATNPWSFCKWFQSLECCDFDDAATLNLCCFCRSNELLTTPLSTHFLFYDNWLLMAYFVPGLLLAFILSFFPFYTFSKESHLFHRSTAVSSVKI
jgi:hypothetical protein